MNSARWAAIQGSVDVGGGSSALRFVNKSRPVNDATSRCLCMGCSRGFLPAFGTLFLLADGTRRVPATFGVLVVAVFFLKRAWALACFGFGDFGRSADR